MVIICKLWLGRVMSYEKKVTLIYGMKLLSDEDVDKAYKVIDANDDRFKNIDLIISGDCCQTTTFIAVFDKSIDFGEHISLESYCNSHHNYCMYEYNVKSFCKEAGIEYVLSEWLLKWYLITSKL